MSKARNWSKVSRRRRTIADPREVGDVAAVHADRGQRHQLVDCRDRVARGASASTMSRRAFTAINPNAWSEVGRRIPRLARKSRKPSSAAKLHEPVALELAPLPAQSSRPPRGRWRSATGAVRWLAAQARNIEPGQLARRKRRRPIMIVPVRLAEAGADLAVLARWFQREADDIARARRARPTRQAKSKAPARRKMRTV